MPREIPMQVLQPTSLEDYIDVVNPALARDKKNLIFFEECYDILERERDIVRQITMFDLLSYFNDAKIDFGSRDYRAVIDFILDLKETTIQRGLSEIVRLTERILSEVTIDVKKVRTHAYEFGNVVGEIADKYRIVQHMTYAVVGYSAIKKSFELHS